MNGEERHPNWSLLEKHRLAAEEKRALEEECASLTELAKGLAEAELPELVGLAGLERELEDRCRELENVCAQAEEELAGVEDPVLRELLRGHFVEGLEWEKLAERMEKSVKWVYWKVGGARPKGEAKGEGTP